MDNRPLTSEQLRDHLRRQLNHLRNSARLFDEGDGDEAVRLASTVRVLVHHTRKSHALLIQLGLRESARWVDTCRHRDDVAAEQRALIDRNFGPDSGLVIAAETPSETGLVTLATDAVTLGPRWAAPLTAARTVKLSAFKDWWEKPGIETSSGHVFTRKDLVLAMANKDGGAHVDPTVPADYDDFTRDYLGFQWASGDYTLTDPPGGWNPPAGNVAMASMRQVAWEVEETLYRLGLPWLLRP